MALYHFTVRSGDHHDVHVQDLPNPQAVPDLAITFAGEMLRDMKSQLFKNDLTVEVADGSGLTLLHIMVAANMSAGSDAAISHWG